jgi:four helix bundle protein
MEPIARHSRRVDDHRNLLVWQKAIDLAVEVHRVVQLLPTSQRFRLVHQMETASVSIAANIAEGKGRNQPRDFARFLAIARGSARELDTYCVLSRRFNYLADQDLAEAESLLDEIMRMLTTLIRRLAQL